MTGHRTKYGGGHGVFGQGSEFNDRKNPPVLTNPLLGKNRLVKTATSDQAINDKHDRQ